MKPRPKPAGSGRTLSPAALASAYAACAAIVGLCVRQAIVLPDRRLLYIWLAAAALAYGIFITVMNNKNKKISERRD